MEKKPLHPYYAGLLRWIADHPPYTVASLAATAGLNNSTVRRAIEYGSAPLGATADKIKAVTGVGYEAMIAWPSPDDPDRGKVMGIDGRIAFKFQALEDPVVRKSVEAMLDGLLAQQGKDRAEREGEASARKKDNKATRKSAARPHRRS